jgi:hypothetical protein
MGVAAGARVGLAGAAARAGAESSEASTRAAWQEHSADGNRITGTSGQEFLMTAAAAANAPRIWDSCPQGIENRHWLANAPIERCGGSPANAGPPGELAWQTARLRHRIRPSRPEPALCDASDLEPWEGSRPAAMKPAGPSPSVFDE